MFNRRLFYGFAILAIFLLNIGYPLEIFSTYNSTKSNTNSSSNPQQQYKIVPVNSKGLQSSPVQTSNGQEIGNSASGSNGLQIGDSGNAQIKPSSASGIVYQQQKNDSGWYSLDWSYRKNITIDHTKFTANETNFPLLLDIYDRDLKLALKNGYDILFTDANGNKLSYERITFNRDYNATYAHLVVWVKSTYSSVTNTILIMYFGNPFSPDQQDRAGTWNNGYQAVYHLNTAGPVIIDSTGHYNATSNFQSSASQKSVLGNAIYFSGSDSINLGNINSNSWTGLTVETWVNRSTIASSTFISKGSGSSSIWSLEATSNKQFNTRLYTDSGSTTSTMGNTLSTANKWYDIALTWNGTQMLTYVDGSILATNNGINGPTLFDSNANVSLGAYASGSNYLTGLLDEVRISNVARSSAWLIDSRANELNPSSFYSVNPNYEQIKLAGNWSFNQLDYRKPLTIFHSSVPQMLYNYTIPLTLFDSDLKVHAQTGTFPNDILFTNANGTKIGQQIEYYKNNFNITDAKLVVWLNIPVLSNKTDTTIYMYYGNSQVIRYDRSNQIWTDYNAVWHLSDTSSTILDSTGNGYTGTSNGNLLSSGKIANGQSFNGQSNIQITSSGFLNSNNLSISGWFKLKNNFTSSTSKTQIILSKFLNSTENMYLGLVGLDNLAIGVPKGSLVFKVETGFGTAYIYSTQTNWLANKWYKFTILHYTNAPTQDKIYINGNLNTNSTVGSCSSCSLNYSANLNFGGGKIDPTDVLAQTAFLNGSLDEIKVSSIIPNSKLINYSYIIESNSPSQYINGTETYGDFLPPLIQSFGVDDPGTGQATFWAKITDKSGVASAYMNISGEIFPLKSNGTSSFMTVTPFTNITFDKTYAFTVVNATDTVGHTENNILPITNYTFSKDLTKPVVSSWTYNPNLSNNGTFLAQVTDSWPGIKNVTVYVQCSVSCPTPNYATMKYNSTSGYFENNSLYLIGQAITFYILAYDVAGNFINTSLHSGIVNDKPASVSNVQLNSYHNLFLSNSSITLTYSYTDPENNTDNSLIYWYNNGTLLPSYNNSVGLPTSAFKRGDQINVKIIPYDGIIYSSPVNSSVYIIINTPPSLTVSLSTVDSSTNLTATYSASDFDMDSLSYNIWWYNNSVLVPSLNNTFVVDYTYTKRYESWYFKLSVSDGTNTTTRISNPINITNSPPIIIGTPNFNNFNTSYNPVNLTAVYSYFDNDNDSQHSPIIYWYVNYTYMSNLTNATTLYQGSTTYPLYNNSIYYYVIRVYDGIRYSANYTSVVNPLGQYIDRHAPVISNLYFVNANGSKCINNCTYADSITIIYAYYDNDSNPEIGTLYNWYMWNGTSWIHQSQYDGLKTIPKNTFTHFEQWYVNVTPSDGQRYGNSVNSSVIKIVNIIPVITSLTGEVLTGSGTYTVVSNTTTDKDLYAFWKAFDGDGDPLLYNISWYNGSTLFSFNQVSNLQSVLASIHTKKNETWTFNITAYDTYNYSATYSFSILIIDSAPVLSNIQLTGGQNVTVPITVTYVYSDADNDPSQSFIKWYINGIWDPSLTSNVLPANSFHAGDEIYAVVIGFDGTLNGTILTSIKITVSDAIPSINTLYLYQGNQSTWFYANSTLLVYFNATDPDGNYLTYGLYTGQNYYKPNVGAEYRWYLNGTLQSQFNNYQNISASYLHHGDVWMVKIRPIDQAGEYGIVYVSQNITIQDFRPEILNVQISDPNPSSSTPSFSVSFTPYDADTVDTVTTTIYWYINGVYNSSLTNNPTITSDYYKKYYNVTIIIGGTDGNLTAINATFSVIIADSAPTISTVSIPQNLYTNQSIYISYTYSDYDGDLVYISSIYWYKNFKLQTNLNNSYPLSSIYTTKGDIWFANITISDGNLSSSVQSSNYVFIINSAPYAIHNKLINDLNASITYTNESLQIYYLYQDADSDIQGQAYVRWYLYNGSSFILQGYLNNSLFVPSSDTTKGEVWYAQFKVFDGTVFSILYTTNNITISNSPPYIIAFGFDYNNTYIENPPANRNFFMTFENISLDIKIADSDAGDTNQSILLWYKNGLLQPFLNGSDTVPYYDLVPGDTWQAYLFLSDGQYMAKNPIKSITIHVENVPTLLDGTHTVPNGTITPTEGQYYIILVMNDTNNQMVRVDYLLDPNAQTDPAIKTLVSGLSVYQGKVLNETNGKWESNLFDLFQNTDRSLFKNYIGKTIVFTVTVYFKAFDPNNQSITYLVSRTFRVSFIITDQTPPTVENVGISFNNNNSLITFNATIVDYGSGVKNVTIYYEFVPLTQGSSTSTTSKIYSFPNYPFQAELIHTTGNDYAVTVPFPGNASVRILYRIVVFDNAGNGNPNAYPKGGILSDATTFQYNPPAIPLDQVAILMVIIIIIALIGTFVGIRRFRSTEIVGLDVDRVMEEALKYHDADVQELLNVHSLGIIVSIFHQTHGPLPIFALPTILTDNLEKLIDLSDRAFSAVRFVEDFETEMQITFDYSISSSIRVASVSYGFSLNRPEARGGAENISLNILMHKPYDAIIGQFITKLDPLVHEIHKILDTDEENKVLVERKTQELRNLVSKIIQAYEKLYPDQAIEEIS